MEQKEEVFETTVETEEKKKKRGKLTKADMMNMLEKVYSKSIDGIPHVSPAIEDLANQYLTKYSDVKKAAKSFINYQITKCTTSGFLTGFGGLITLPITLSANITSVMYVQMRMIACIAYMGGYSVNDDQTQTLVYACLAGVSVDELIKQAGIKIGTKMTNSLIKKIPGKALTKINQKVGFRLMTKFGTKGVINLGKMIPVVGAVIGGGMDFIETKIIANRAYKLFIDGDTSVLDKADKDVDYNNMEQMDSVEIELDEKSGVNIEGTVVGYNDVENDVDNQ